MPLRVSVADARPASQTASPAIVFRLHIEAVPGGRVHAAALRCQIRIEPRRRRYTPEEQQRLYELFGDRSQWDRTLRDVAWSSSSLVVPTFDREIDVELPVPCTYDLEVGSAKYLHAVRDGTIPLVFLFSGTIFNAGAAGLQVEPVPWDLDAAFSMPASVWRATMNQFFPGGGWLRIGTETLDRLQAFRGRHAVVSWDEAIARLFDQAGQREIA